MYTISKILDSIAPATWKPLGKLAEGNTSKIDTDDVEVLFQNTIDPDNLQKDEENVDRVEVQLDGEDENKRVEPQLDEEITKKGRGSRMKRSRKGTEWRGTQIRKRRMTKGGETGRRG